jgi:serine/threonine-protein kinase
VAYCPHCGTALADGLRFCGQCGAIAPGAVTGAAGDPWLGKVVDGRYRVTGRIGTGGMGIVYKVEHLHLGKNAAMKVLAPDTAQRPEMLRRFKLEAQAVSRLNHPNIVQTFDFGQSDGALYLVMEHIKGEDLATIVKRDGPWSFERAARLFVQVCSGLSEAHEAGIVHRDLKPENLMVVHRRDGSEHVKVLDFGLAKLRERADAAGISSSGQVLGTPYYMAPEQVRGEALDARADIYSLGATLYRVLTGEPPFDAPSPMSVLAKHLTDEVVPPSRRAGQPPGDADRIVLRAMEKSAAHRYQSAAEVQADLERALGAPAKSPSVATVPIRPRARPPSLANAATLVQETSDPAVDDERLRRADVDEYEWSLRRRRLVWRFLVPSTIVLAATVGVLVWRGFASRADTFEREPNNTPGYANPLVSGVSVRGAIGKPLTDREGDVDMFRIPAGRGPRALQARLEGIPGVDLVIELFDAQGRRVAKGDAHGRGLGEWLQPTSIAPTESFLAVREVWIEGVAPTIDAPDGYTLTARWGPPLPDWEVEPNDSPAAATPLPASGRVRGYLGTPEDKDWFTITLDRRGKVPATVEAPAGVDVVVFLDEQGKRVIDRHSAGEREELTLDAEPGRPLLIGVGRKLDPKKDPKEQALAALDDPYEIKIDVAGGN